MLIWNAVLKRNPMAEIAFHRVAVTSASSAIRATAQIPFLTLYFSPNIATYGSLCPDECGRAWEKL
jgi:hypothetical protein